MQQTESMVKMENALYNIDTDITIKVIEHLHTYNMRYLDDPKIKGSGRVKARGVFAVMAKEQRSMRQAEYISKAVSNPTLQQIHGVKGMVYMVGEMVKSLEMDLDRAIPNYDDVEQLAPEPIPGQGAATPGVSNQVPGTGEQPRQLPPPGSRTLDVAGNPAGGAATAPAPEG